MDIYELLLFFFLGELYDLLGDTVDILFLASSGPQPLWIFKYIVGLTYLVWSSSKRLSDHSTVLCQTARTLFEKEFICTAKCSWSKCQLGFVNSRAYPEKANCQRYIIKIKTANFHSMFK